MSFLCIAASRVRFHWPAAPALSVHSVSAHNQRVPRVSCFLFAHGVCRLFVVSKMKFTIYLFCVCCVANPSAAQLADTSCGDCGQNTRRGYCNNGQCCCLSGFRGEKSAVTRKNSDFRFHFCFCYGVGSHHFTSSSCPVENYLNAFITSFETLSRLW